jgi:hypothetical protein
MPLDHSDERIGVKALKRRTANIAWKPTGRPIERVQRKKGNWRV